MDLDALRSFIAFVDTGSFTRAAKQTYRSQSAISMQMKKLESDCGQTLFVKEGRNLVLTEQGQLLVSYARRMLSLHDEVVGAFAQGHQHPPLTIGCPDDYADSVLTDVIKLIQQLIPELSFQIHCDSSIRLRKQLDAGEIDLTVMTRSPESDEGYLLKHDRGVWIKQPGSTLDQADTLSLILFGNDCKFNTTAIDSLEKQGRNFKVISTSSNATAIKSLVAQELGIGAMATASVGAELEIIQNPDLPALPAIDIVLAIGPTPHPLFGRQQAQLVSEQFRRMSDG